MMALVPLEKIAVVLEQLVEAHEASAEALAGPVVELALAAGACSGLKASLAL